MADERYSRTVNLIGEEGLARLRAARVIVIGNGGVGSYAAEAVVRAGVGHVTFMDGDVVAPSNLNRQLVALTSTLGMNKAEVMAARARDINPDTEVTALGRFYRDNDELDLTQFDWIIDAIDDVDAKTALICKAKDLGVNIISAMGAATVVLTQEEMIIFSRNSGVKIKRITGTKLVKISIGM
jgi:tRNA A37 threonylcarbamoyladenosine dehydratase